MVLGPALRSAGGLSVGKDMVEAVVKVAPENEYLFVLPADVGYEGICERVGGSQGVFLPPSGFLSRLWFDRFKLPRIAKQFAPDAILGITALGLANPGCVQTALVDQPQLIYPDKHFGPRSIKDKLRHAYIRWQFRRQLPNTQIVLCRTPVVAKRIRDQYGYQGNALVCGASVSPRFSVSVGDNVPPEYQGLEGKTKLLYPTRYYAHKNIERVVEMFVKYKTELKDITVFLTLSRDHHKNVDQILEKIDKNDLENNIVNLGTVPREKIGSYFAHSDAIFMPTLLETLGVPYLEALQASVPILSSDIDFARTTCGERATYFDPWDLVDMKDSILEFRESNSLNLRTPGDVENQEDVRNWDQVAETVLSQMQLAMIQQSK